MKLVPGMPVDTFVDTGIRTAISYLLKPFNGYDAERAFRERMMPLALADRAAWV